LAAPYVTAIIVAGGQGLRLGGPVPKQFRDVGGRPILERAASAFLNHPQVNDVIVALPSDLAANPPSYLRAGGARLRVVAGGGRRQDSVLNAFRAVDERADVVVVHDGARPFVTAEVIARAIEAAAESGAALTALPSRDTVKRASAGETGTPAYGLVIETLPRETIYFAQTPQAFRRHILRDALALAETGVEATDEAALVERTGVPVRIVEGAVSNIKVTTAEDLVLAEVLAHAADAAAARAISPGEADRRPEPTSAPVKTAAFRIGTGYDLHRLVEGRPLILGGVTIPHERGLLGHSDADAVCHAITDAVLGAAGAGDIGLHFPDSDPRWRGASSLDLLRQAGVLVRDKGFVVSNVDAVVIAERPKIGPYVAAMRETIADVLALDADAVSIKGKTNEGVGELGRGEAIAVHATALVVRV
jgi:2-C-methyl-D-erythritol 4-phosphate cytidylyltransferase/2-C-methyl-D-erythritol 2,4-cyclodiphosphate synthase